MGRKHTQALKAKTQELDAFTTKTFISVVDHGTEPPYIVWHPANGSNTQDRVTGPRGTKNPRYVGHIVGVDADQVQLLTDLLEALLLPNGRGITLTVEDEKSHPMWLDSPLPIQVLTDPQPSVVYQVVECGWRSEPEV